MIGVQSVSDAIKLGHRELEAQYDQFVDSTDDEERARLGSNLVWELARHAVCEEALVYPAVESYVRDGKAIVEGDARGRQMMNDQVLHLTKLTPGGPEFVSLLEAIMSGLKDHVREQELHHLAAFERGLRASESEALAKAIQQTGLLVPSPDRPASPEEFPFASPEALLEAPVDMIRDLVNQSRQE